MCVCLCIIYIASLLIKLGLSFLLLLGPPCNILRSRSCAARIKGGTIAITVPESSLKDSYEAGTGRYRAMVAHAQMK